MDWTTKISDQLNWHWANQLRPRLDGLSDIEYFWEPVEACWSVRLDANGQYVMDVSRPEPSPPPVTTIAWRMCHLIGSVLAARNASYFGGPSFDADTFAYPSNAREALEMLDQRYAMWKAGVAALDEDALGRTARERFGRVTMAALILHIQREVIHHGAEIALIRDLFRATRLGQVPVMPPP
ncbi:MAG: DinB family protein [Chloroflexi bacterium]|nr:DinB family protein [Chloroflexota bacterium]